MNPSKFITVVHFHLTEDLSDKHFGFYGMQLNENTSLQDKEEENQGRCYLLTVFAELNRDAPFSNLHFKKEDERLVAQFVAPSLLYSVQDVGISPEYFKNTDTSIDEINERVSRLTTKQKEHYDTVCNRVADRDSIDNNLFFLDALAGSGKTFLLNVMIKSLKIFSPSLYFYKINTSKKLQERNKEQNG